MSSKRVAGKRNLEDAPSVVPRPAANTPLGRAIDVDPTIDEAKRRRLEHPDLQKDAQVADSIQNAQPDIVPQQTYAEAVLAPIMQQFKAINNRLDTIYNRLGALINQHHVDVVMAFAVNRAAVNRSAPVQPVPRLSDMQVPPGFPETLGELKDLDGAAVTRFLKFYLIPIDGNVRLRQNRLFAHLGVKLNV